MTGRSVDLWEGSTPDAAIPARVRLRKPDGMDWSLALIRHWSRVDEATGCWVWLKARNKNGYGAIRLGSHTRSAHRVAYELALERQLPRHVDVCHTCDNRACVNPAHLFEGSRRDNMQDCVAKGRFKLPPRLAGAASPHAKLTEDQARAIRASDKATRALAREYGVCRSTIKQLRVGRTWRGL